MFSYWINKKCSNCLFIVKHTNEDENLESVLNQFFFSKSRSIEATYFYQKT